MSKELFWLIFILVAWNVGNPLNKRYLLPKVLEKKKYDPSRHEKRANWIEYAMVIAYLPFAIGLMFALLYPFKIIFGAWYILICPFVGFGLADVLFNPSQGRRPFRDAYISLSLLGEEKTK